MSDEAGKVDGTSNSTPMFREPPPSLGMVAHIWAGHLGPVDGELSGSAAAVESESPSLGDDLIDLPSWQAHPATTD